MSKVLVVAPQVGQARDPQVSSIIASPSPFPIPVRLPLPVWRIGVMNVSVTATPCQERPQMKTFTIDNENNISVFATQEEAPAATATPSDSSASQQELADLAAHWPAERLLAVWNSLPGVTAVKKFKDRNTAISRIWARIQGLGEPVAPKAPPPGGPAGAEGGPPRKAEGGTEGQRRRTGGHPWRTGRQGRARQGQGGQEDDRPQQRAQGQKGDRKSVV